MSTAIEKLSLKKVMTNLNKEVRAIEGRTMLGMIDAAIIIRRDMDRTPPLIPVMTGNLRNSWFTTPIPGSVLVKNPTLIFGFSANYAAYVHEMVGAHFKREGAGAKFFAAALDRNHREILEAIRKEAKVK